MQIIKKTMQSKMANKINNEQYMLEKTMIHRLLVTCIRPNKLAVKIICCFSFNKTN
jgi:hypothetical protein